MIKTYGLMINMVVWRLYMAMRVASSLYTLASRLLHASDTYMLLLWQGLVSNAAQISPRGPYGSGTWLAGASDFKDLPPQLVLPG